MMEDLEEMLIDQLKGPDDDEDEDEDEEDDEDEEEVASSVRSSR
jgi:hypothetical protein